MPHILEEWHCYSDISIERRETFLKQLEMCDFDGAHQTFLSPSPVSSYGVRKE